MGLIGLIAVSGAQSITKIAPTPAQTGIWSACFVDANRGFAAGAKNAFYRTLDGGANWSPITLPGFQSDPIYNVTFLDANVGVASGNSSGLGPDVFRTTDGGSTWSQVTVFPLGGSWYHQDYVSQTVGFMGSNGGIVKTTDAGATWSLRSGYPDCPNMTGMDFTDASVGLATGGLPTFVTGIFKTTDGGLTWQNVQPGAADDVVFLTPTTAVAIVDNMTYRSTNSGTT